MKPIKISDAVLQNDGKRVTNNIHVFEPNLRKFFRSFSFYAEYEKDVSKVPLSILNIPALSSVIHFAWAVGCNVHVGEIDETYLKGLENVSQILKHHQGFKDLKFTTSTTSDKTVDNSFDEMNWKGLLFSGGTDSTSSYIAYHKENPKLIMIWGLDIPLSWSHFWEKTVEQYRWMNLYTIKTNSEEIYYQNKLWTLAPASKDGLVEGYRPTYSFSISTLGVCAPLTIIEHINELMLSSTYPSRQYGDQRYPWAQRRPNFIIDQFFRWNDVRTYDILHEYTTNEKVKYFLKPHFDKHGPLYLRSCGHRRLLTKYRRERLNCCECDKCQRVIGMLTVNGIDPNICGFHVTRETYEKIKINIIEKKWNPNYLKYHWTEIKGCIPDKVTTDFNGSRAFLKWLRGYNL